MKERLGWAPLAVGVMLGCIVLAVARLVEMAARIGGVAGGWYAAFFASACALAALGAYCDRRLRWRRERSVEGPDGWKLLALEFVTFFLLAKLGSYAGRMYAGESLAQIGSDVQNWVRDPGRILDGETLVALILGGLSWLLFTQTLVDLENLGEDPAFWSDAQSGSLGMPVPQVRLANRFLWGGVVLLFVTGLNWLGANVSQGWSGIGALWSALFANRDASAAFPVWQAVNVLVYFCLGLVMMGQVRLVALRQDWKVQRAAVAEGIGGRWWRYSLAFVGLAAAAALLLPTGYTTGLLDVLRYGLAVVLHALYTFATTLMVLVSLPFFLLAQWIFGEGVVVPKLPAQRPGHLSLPLPSGSGPAWLGVVRAAFFWLALLGLTMYLVQSFLREHPQVWRALASFRLVRWLRQWLASWWARVALWRAARARQRSRGTLGGQEQIPGGMLFSDRRMPGSNRGRVRYYYMDVLRHARRAGYPRAPAQTPLAYGAVLGEKLPETREQVALLTDSFVEARYSRHPIERDLVRRVRAGWQRIKQTLGGKREDRD